MNDRNLSHTGMELDLRRLALGLKRRLWLLALAAVLGAAGAAIVGKCLITPRYQSSVMLYVNNAQEQNVYSGDLTTSRNLVDSILVILNTRETMLDVIGFAGVDHSLPEMEKMISATAVNHTEFFCITVTSPDLYEAERIANAIGSVLPERIAGVLEGSSAKVVDPAVIASKPSTPGAGKCACLGGLAGLGLALAAVLLWELFDDTVRTPGELRRPGLPKLLAVLPETEGLLHAKLRMICPADGTVGILGTAAPGLEKQLEAQGRKTLRLTAAAQALERGIDADTLLLTAREGTTRLSELEAWTAELEWAGRVPDGIVYERC